MEHLCFHFAGSSGLGWTPAGTARTSQAEEGSWLPLKNHIKLQISKVFVKATRMIQATLSSGKQIRKLWHMAV